MALCFLLTSANYPCFHPLQILCNSLTPRAINPSCILLVMIRFFSDLVEQYVNYEGGNLICCCHGNNCDAAGVFLFTWLWKFPNWLVRAAAKFVTKQHGAHSECLQKSRSRQVRDLVLGVCCSLASFHLGCWLLCVQGTQNGGKSHQRQPLKKTNLYLWCKLKCQPGIKGTYTSHNRIISLT